MAGAKENHWLKDLEILQLSSRQSSRSSGLWALGLPLCLDTQLKVTVTFPEVTAKAFKDAGYCCGLLSIKSWSQNAT